MGTVWQLTENDISRWENEILALAKGKALICLGEEPHYTEVFQRFHLTLLKLLVEKGHVRALAYETPFKEALLVDAYVRGEDIDPQIVFSKGVNPMFGGWDVFQETVEWMRQYNQTHPTERPLRFYGVDVGSCSLGGNSAWPAIKASVEYLKLKGESSAASFDALVQLAKEHDLVAFKSLPEEKQCWMAAETQRLYDTVIVGLAKPGEMTEKEQIVLRTAWNAILAIRWFLAYADERMTNWSNALREQGMADNLSWVVAQEKGAAVIYHSHNEHIRRTLSNGEMTVGCFLDKLLDPESVLSIGGVSYYSLRGDEEPEENSLVKELHRLAGQTALINMDVPRTCASEEAPFDAMFYYEGDLRYAGMCYRPDQPDAAMPSLDVLAAYTGIYQLESTWLPGPVKDFVTVYVKDGCLYANGLYGPNGEKDSDSTTAEHFPVYDSPLIALNEQTFYFRNYFGGIWFNNPEEQYRRLEFFYFHLGGAPVRAHRIGGVPPDLMDREC